MKAVVYSAYGPVENLAIADVAAPTPRDGEVLVQVHRAALNPKDAIFRRGRFAWLSGRSFPKRSGLDFAGRIRATRSPHFAVGDRVFGALNEWRCERGTLAEEVCASEEEACHIPETVSDDDAAAVALVGLTALQALHDVAQIRSGQRVWIHGASGGVGTVAIQVARALGAGTVITTSSAANLDACRKLGADQALDYRAEPVRALRGSVDIVFDAFGNLRFAEIASVFASEGVVVSTVPTMKRAALHVVLTLHA